MSFIYHNVNTAVASGMVFIRRKLLVCQMGVNGANMASKKVSGWKQTVPVI